MVEFLRYCRADRPLDIVDVVFREGRLTIDSQAGGVRYRGNCHYDECGEVLEIHELSAQPEGSGLGAVLMHATALRAGLLGCRRIRTTATARSALKFYLTMGLYPERGQPPAPEPIRPSDRPRVEAFGAQLDLLRNGPAAISPSDRPEREEFGIQLTLARLSSANWTGERNEITRLAQESFQRKWTFLKHYTIQAAPAPQPAATATSWMRGLFRR